MAFAAGGKGERKKKGKREGRKGRKRKGREKMRRPLSCAPSNL